MSTAVKVMSTAGVSTLQAHLAFALPALHQASLAALAKLAIAKGYRLVATEPHGGNAFFLRNDVGPSIPACTPERAFNLMKRYDLWMQTKKEYVYSYVEQAKLPLVDV